MSDRASYAESKAENFSRLKYILDSPAAYRWNADHPTEDTDALRIGRVEHVAVLQPDRLPLEVAVWQGGRRGTKEYGLFCEAHQHETIINAEEYDLCCLLRDKVRAHPVARGLLERLEHVEVAMEWTDPTTGRAMKGRADGLRVSEGPFLLDLKTTRDPDRRRFAAASATGRYQMQMATYRRGVQATYGIEPPCYLIVVGKKPPFEVAVRKYTEEALAIGDMELDRALALLDECERTGKWPGRYEAEEQIDVPPWYLQDDDGAQSKVAADWLMGAEQ